MRSVNSKLGRFKRIINMLFLIIRFVPKPILNLLLHFFDSSEGKIAILFRYLYLKKYCKSTGQNIYVGKNVNLKNIHNLSIGSNVSIHSFNYLDAYGEISIGNNVSIANHCTLISSDHTWENNEIPIKYNKVEKKPIVIEDDVWIAAGCRILGNVTIKERTVIGAGAVVNRNLDNNSLYVGVPARKVKTIG